MYLRQKEAKKELEKALKAIERGEYDDFVKAVKGIGGERTDIKA